VTPLALIRRITIFGITVVLASVLVLALVTHAVRVFETPRLSTLSRQVDYLESIGGSKIVVMGGSNLAYGLDSEQLADATGMHVMNMGVQASLTLEFMLELVKPHLNEGDIVILGAETAMYRSRPWSTATLTKLMVTNPTSTRFMNWRQIVAAPLYLYPSISDQTETLRRAAGRWVYGSPSFAEGLLANGDYVGHRGKASAYRSSTRPPQSLQRMQVSVPARRQDYLRAFKDFCQQNGIRLYVSFAATAQAIIDPNSLGLVTQFLKSDFDVISDPWDYAYPDSLFYDTSHHLIYEMREVRTAQLIADLLPRLSPN
jgi:hypothetical protein